MKKYFVFLLLCLTPIFGTYAQKIKPNFKLADKWSNLRAMNLGDNSLSCLPTFINNTDKFWYSFTTDEGTKYYLVDPEKKKLSLLFDPQKVAMQLNEESREIFNDKKLNLSHIKFNKKGDSFTFEHENNKYRYNLKTQQISKIDTVKPWKGIENWKQFSPDSTYIVFSKGDNLFMIKNKEKGGDGKEIQLTFDGEKNFTYAYEPMEDDTIPTTSIAKWFKNSKKIFALRDDNRELKDLWVINSLERPRPKLITYKYDMAGDSESFYTHLDVIDVETRKITHIKLEKWHDQYVEVLYPSEDGKRIYFKRTNRKFDTVEICVGDTETGEVKTLIQEIDKPYIDFKMANVTFLNDGKDILFRSERTGWGHFYLYDGEGNFKHAITSGPWVAGPINKIDTLKRTVYFFGLGREKNVDPYYYMLYKVNIDHPESLELLTPGNAHHASSFVSKSGNYIIDNYQRVDLAPCPVVRNKHGKIIMELPKPDLKRVYAAGWKAPERFSVKSADGVTDLYGVMWKPFDFDSTKCYPIISYVYPGPQFEFVPTQFSLIHDRNTRLAQLGFIVISVGHRGGTPMRGKAYHTYSSGRLRDYPLADDKYAIEQLAQRYSFINGKKVGIYGHSGGGFMATAAICTYPDFYSAAVSAAGNHDNTIYNKWFVEVHNGVTEIPDTISGKSSWEVNVGTNMQLAKNYKGGLLLVTGDIDNNVNPAHTFRMVNALIKEGKNFDMMVLPGSKHGFTTADDVFYEHKLWFHFIRHLMDDNSADWFSGIKDYRDQK